jgi:phosphohistidine phosphatase SixA
MKTITFIRHAKSDKSNSKIEDIDRWLDKKWEKQIKYIWNILKNINYKTKLILCSKARITTITLNWLKAVHNKLDKETKYINQLYDNLAWDSKDMLDIIKIIDNEIDDITIIWHNPMFDNSINYFLNTTWFHSRTLWITKILFDVKKWENIENNGKLISYISPEI